MGFTQNSLAKSWFNLEADSLVEEISRDSNCKSLVLDDSRSCSILTNNAVAEFLIFISGRIRKIKRRKRLSRKLRATAFVFLRDFLGGLAGVDLLSFPLFWDWGGREARGLIFFICSLSGGIWFVLSGGVNVNKVRSLKSRLNDFSTIC